MLAGPAAGLCLGRDLGSLGVAVFVLDLGLEWKVEVACVGVVVHRWCGF